MRIEPGKIEKFWLRDEHGHPCALVAYRVVETPGVGPGRAIDYATAVLRKGDVFSREFVHGVVEDRLNLKRASNRPCGGIHRVDLASHNDPRMAIVGNIQYRSVHVQREQLPKHTPGFVRLLKLAVRYEKNFFEAVKKATT